MGNPPPLPLCGPLGITQFSHERGECFMFLIYYVNIFIASLPKSRPPPKKKKINIPEIKMLENVLPLSS